MIPAEYNYPFSVHICSFQQSTVRMWTNTLHHTQRGDMWGSGLQCTSRRSQVYSVLQDALRFTAYTDTLRFTVYSQTLQADSVLSVVLRFTMQTLECYSILTYAPRFTVYSQTLLCLQCTRRRSQVHSVLTQALRFTYCTYLQKLSCLKCTHRHSHVFNVLTYSPRITVYLHPLSALQCRQTQHSVLTYALRLSVYLKTLPGWQCINRHSMVYSVLTHPLALFHCYCLLESTSFLFQCPLF